MTKSEIQAAQSEFKGRKKDWENLAGRLRTFRWIIGLKQVLKIPKVKVSSNQELSPGSSLNLANLYSIYNVFNFRYSNNARPHNAINF